MLIFLVMVLLVVPVGLVRGGGLSAETPQMKSKIYVQQANQDQISHLIGMNKDVKRLLKVY